MVNCQIHGKEKIVLAPLVPLEPKPDEVLIRLGAGGICGSDLHYYFEGKNGSFVVREPMTPGHEASGVLEAVGSNVKRLAAGMKVAVRPLTLLPTASNTPEASWPGVIGSRTTKLPFLPSK